MYGGDLVAGGVSGGDEDAAVRGKSSSGVSAV